MTTDITDNDKINIFITSLIDFNEHIVAAKIFEDALVHFVPKMMANFLKKIKKEGSNRLH